MNGLILKYYQYITSDHFTYLSRVSSQELPQGSMAATSFKLVAPIALNIGDPVDGVKIEKRDVQHKLHPKACTCLCYLETSPSSETAFPAPVFSLKCFREGAVRTCANIRMNADTDSKPYMQG